MTPKPRDPSGRSAALAHPKKGAAVAPFATASSAAADKEVGHRRKEPPQVTWYAAAVIVIALLLAGGLELWRWILLVITLD